MADKIYTTNSIVSFKVSQDELIETFIYVPLRRAVQDTIFGKKIVFVGGGWISKNELNDELYPINLKPKSLIKEDKKTYLEEKVIKYYGELSFVNDDKESKCLIQDSEFDKFFNKTYGNYYYYIVDSDKIGFINKIKIFKKGFININLNNGYELYCYTSINQNILNNYIDDVGFSIESYKFFKIDYNELYFIKFLDNKRIIKKII